MSSGYLVPTGGSTGFIAAIVKGLLAGLFLATVVVTIVGQQVVLASLPAGVSETAVGVVGGELDIALWMSVFVAAGVYLWIYGFALSWQWLRLLGSDAIAVVDVTPRQPVEVEGTARPLDQRVTGPISGGDCLAYEYRIDRYSNTGEGWSWRTEVVDSAGVEFVLEDETGQLLVEPAGADFVFETEAVETITEAADASEVVSSLVEEHDGVTMDELKKPHGRLRFTEYRLDPGESVYVSGVAAEGDAQSVCIAAPTGPTGQLRRYLQAPFIISDSDESSLEDQLRNGSLGLFAVGLLLIGITVTFYLIML